MRGKGFCDQVYPTDGQKPQKAITGIPLCPNLPHDLHAIHINQGRVAGIAYIGIMTTFVYLAVNL
jgi:hypothetical protein